jgi:hypothetical protein
LGRSLRAATPLIACAEGLSARASARNEQEVAAGKATKLFVALILLASGVSTATAADLRWIRESGLLRTSGSGRRQPHGRRSPRDAPSA